MPDAEPFAVLNDYLDDLHAGRRPDREALLARHPELAGLVGSLESLDRLIPSPSSATAEFPNRAGDLRRDVTLGPGDSSIRATVSEISPEFGHYELLGEIGRGGMGVVYKARQKELDRIVAIKMILASHLAADDQIRRFQAETRTAARLRHPHIVQIHEAGEIHGQHYFVMEFMDGPSLTEALAERRPTPDEAAQLVVCVARAVAHLHAQGIVHRDLKPSNILLRPRDDLSATSPPGTSPPPLSHYVPKITDFGLVKVAGSDGEATRTGVIVGTPSYMAPEQAAGRPSEVGPLCDVYSLGAILYEMLTGRPPFREATPLDTLVQVIEGEPTPPRQLHSGVPRELDLICLKCLEKPPERRYASADAVADDLERFLRGEGVDARPQGLWQKLRRWSRREPALTSRLGGLAVFAAIAQTGYLVFYNVPWAVHACVMGLLAGWAAISFGCQKLLPNPRWGEATKFVWAAADIVLLTVLLWITENETSPVVIGYPLLVSGSGLWFRVRLVWFTTIAGLAGYAALLAGLYLSGRSIEYPHHQAVFFVAMIVLGFVVAYQVKRVRVLSRYYERRPLG